MMVWDFANMTLLEIAEEYHRLYAHYYKKNILELFVEQLLAYEKTMQRTARQWSADEILKREG